MKIYLVLLVGLLSFTQSVSAKTLAIYSNDGQFTIALNGIIQVSNVNSCKITGLTESSYKAQITINGEEFEKSAYLNPDEEITVFNLKKNKKGGYGLSYGAIASLPSTTIETSFKSDGEVAAIVPEKEDVDFISRPVNVVYFQMDGFTRKFFLIIDGKLQNETAATHLQVDGVPSGVHKVKVVFEESLMEDLKPYNGTDMFIGHTDLDGVAIEKNEVRSKAHPLTLRTYKILRDEHYKVYNSVKSDVVVVPFQFDNKLLSTANNMKVNRAVNELQCNVIVSKEDLIEHITQINKKHYEFSKIELCEIYVLQNCLTSKQIGELFSVLEFDSERYTLATFAYEYCIDPENYSQLKTSFKYVAEYDRMNEKLGL